MGVVVDGSIRIAILYTARFAFLLLSIAPSPNHLDLVQHPFRQSRALSALPILLPSTVG